MRARGRLPRTRLAYQRASDLVVVATRLPVGLAKYGRLGDTWLQLQGDGRRGFTGRTHIGETHAENGAVY